jgi:hypothetical protein
MRFARYPSSGLACVTSGLTVVARNLAYYGWRIVPGPLGREYCQPCLALRFEFASCELQFALTAEFNLHVAISSSSGLLVNKWHKIR